MKTVYRCHNHFLRSNAVILRFFGFLLFLVWFVPVAHRLGAAPAFLMPFGLACSLTLTLAMLLLASLFVNREIREAVCVVSDDGVTMTMRGRTKKVRFADTVAFRFVRVPFLVAYGEIADSRTAIRFPFTLADLPALIDDIEDRLLLSDKSDALNVDNIRLFVVRARLSRMSTLRLQKLAPAVEPAMAGFFLCGLVAAQAFWEFPLVLSVAWSLFSATVPVAACVTYDLLLSRALRPLLMADSEAVVSADNPALLTRTMIVAGILYLALGVAVKLLVRYAAGM